jgi:molybdenum cofactor biosynthesis enzyme
MKNLKIIKNNELKDWAEEIFKKNSFNMVDVSSKKETYRRALASGKIYVGKEVFNLIKNKEMPKGDPITLAEISAVLGVKKTSELIPYVIRYQLIIQLLKSLCMMKIIHLKFFVLYLRLQKQVWRWKL